MSVHNKILFLQFKSLDNECKKRTVLNNLNTLWEEKNYFLLFLYLEIQGKTQWFSEGKQEKCAVAQDLLLKDILVSWLFKMLQYDENISEM